jgi:hypothetical protein
MTDVDDWRDHHRGDWEPSEPDWEALEYEQHLNETHDGYPCDCPKPTPGRRSRRAP